MNKTGHETGQLDKHVIGLHVLPRLHCRLSSLKSMVLSTRALFLNTYTLLILLMALTVLTLLATSLHPTDVEIQGMAGGTKQITLPLEEPSEVSGQNSKTYILTGSFSYSLFSQHMIHITPDDCVESFRINGVDVDLDEIMTGNTCDWRNGFDIDLKNYLKEGTNPFEIRLIDYGGSFGLRIQHSSYDRLYFVLLQILILETATLLYLLLKNHLQLPQGIILIILLGVLLRLLYLSYTPYDVRAYDEAGHLDYIKYVATNWRLPDPNSGWEYFQAPLYYVTAAVVYTIARNGGLDTQSVLQGLSLVSFTVLLIFGVLLFRRVCKTRWLFLTSTALLVFWPSGIIDSVRISNDVMYDMFFVMAMYFLMRWLVDKESHHFYMASVCMAFTIMTKLNGLVLIGIFVCVWIMPLLRKGVALVRSAQLKTSREHAFSDAIVTGTTPLAGSLEDCSSESKLVSSLHQIVWLYLKKLKRAEYRKNILFFLSVVVLALAISLFRNVSLALHDSHYDILVSNVSENASALYVGNSVRNYTYFDLHTYMTKAFTDPWDDAGGRQYFWNFFLKSMLFGEFSFPSAVGQWVAIMLSASLLLMIVFLFIGVYSSIRELEPSNLLLLLWLLLSILSLLYVHHTYPISGFANFRYILPTIIPFLYFYLTGVDFLMARKLRIIGTFGYILAYLFILGTCFFFLIPLGG